ncbi:MAG: chemotaxis-specific protein-glutamate methyltransferase CheB [Deltaproteobacteria bacterium]
MSETRPLRVLVVDDSVLHRQTISELLKGAPDVEIVGKAANGEEALRMCALVHPDLITLDLEMPRMDGFTFLRFLMARQPTPVIVISSQSQRENVFKALELGALDFVSRPTGGPSEIAKVRDELLSKVSVVRSLRPVSRQTALRPTTGAFMLGGGARSRVPTPTPLPPATTAGPARIAPKRLVVIAASTGGPQAILELVGRLPATTQLGIVIAQHMPERFTKTFAERLHRRTSLRIAEGEDGAWIEAGTVWICPGGRASEIVMDSSGVPRLRVLATDSSDRYVPSADRLFRSVEAAGIQNVLAVVLTGMGDDGAAALPGLDRVGAEIWVESAESAIVDGMPACARKTGLADQVLPLTALITKLVQL